MPPPADILRELAAFPERVGNKIDGVFYPLTEPQLRALYLAKRSGLGNLITNSCYVFHALRLENPFGDRPLEFTVKEFAGKWDMALSSCYAAFARLRDIGIVECWQGITKLLWVSDPSPQVSDAIANSTPPPAAEVVSPPKSPKPSGDKPKTRKPLAPPAPLNLSSELIAQLEAVKVDYSRKDVGKAIAQASPEQLAGAIAHMKEKWDLIETNYSNGHSTIFLKELAKRANGSSPEPPKGGPLSPEFKDWYAQAIAEGIVIPRPIEHLPISGNQPMVTLANGENLLWTEARKYDKAKATAPPERANLAKLKPELLKRLKPPSGDT
jgi:hypothetical protein